MTGLRFAVAAVIGLGSIACPTPATSAPHKRSVHLEIRLPNGTDARLIVPEGEGGSIRLVNQTTYGFVPAIHEEGKASKVVVDIWVLDEVPHRRLGMVEATPGGPVVTSDTAPRFSIRVVRVGKGK